MGAVGRAPVVIVVIGESDVVPRALEEPSVVEAG